MTDREEMKQFFDIYDNLEGYTDSDKAIALGAWQARGALDAVRIKELEEELKDADGAAQILANQKVELSLQVAQLREAFAECLTVTPHYMVSKTTAEKWKALAYGTSTPSQDEWVRKSEIGELTAKLDKAREGLEFYADRKNWHKDSQQFNSFEVSDFNIIYNDFYEQNQATRYAGNIAKQALEELDK